MLTKIKISYAPYTPGWTLTQQKITKNLPMKISYIFPQKKSYISGQMLTKRKISYILLYSKMDADKR